MSDLDELGRLRMIIEQTFKGGEGSGNFGHEGRPGEVGGSSSGGSYQNLSYSDFIKNAKGIDRNLNKHILYVGHTNTSYYGVTVLLHFDDSISDDTVKSFADKAIKGTNWKVERINTNDMSPNMKGNSKSILWKKGKGIA